MILKNRTLVASILLVIFASLLACNKQLHFEVDIEAGPASETFRILAEQTDVGIVFEGANFDRVKTNAISGDMTVEKALKLMTTDTALAFRQDTGDGVFSVHYRNH